MPHNFLITYPEDGTKKTDLAKGVIHFDFWEGVVTLQDGTKINLKRKLKNSSQAFIRSLILYATDVTKISLGTSRPIAVFGNPCAWQKFENLSIREATVETLTTQIPNESDFVLIASTANKSSFTPEVIVLHEFRSKAATATTDNFVTMFERRAFTYEHNTFIIRETGGVNGLTYNIQGKQNSGGTYVNLQADAAVAANGEDVVQIQGIYHFIRLQVKATVAASQAEFTGEYGGMG